MKILISSLEIKISSFSIGSFAFNLINKTSVLNLDFKTQMHKQTCIKYYQ